MIINICRWFTFGDSLSDRGTLASEKLFGLIPMGLLSGLHDKSPMGRFDNGYVWVDFVSAAFLEKRVREDLNQHFGLSDDIITQALKDQNHAYYPIVAKWLSEAFSLNDDKYVCYWGRPVVRTYNEGGLTAADWDTSFTIDPTIEGARLIVSTLKDKCKECEEYDKSHSDSVTAEVKAKTLITEWTGANDLVTVNDKPSKEIAKKAIIARIENVSRLAKDGYQHFVLVNLPDISLTPRFQADNISDEERQNLSNVVTWFNEELQRACKDFQSTHPDITLEIYDINTQFSDIYKNAAAYGFDVDKLKTYLTKDPNYTDTKDQPPINDIYMFWNYMHPSQKMQQILAERLYKWMSERYAFELAPNVDRQAIKTSHDNKAILASAFFKFTAQQVAEQPSLAEVKTWLEENQPETANFDDLKVLVNKLLETSKAYDASWSNSAYSAFNSIASFFVTTNSNDTATIILERLMGPLEKLCKPQVPEPSSEKMSMSQQQS